MTINKDRIIAALQTVSYPATRKNIVESEMLADDLAIDGNKVSLSLIFPRDTDPFLKSTLKAAEAAIHYHLGKDVEVNISPLFKSKPRPTADKLLPEVSNIIAVSSGKGGVGKSTVAANLAIALARMGYQVGLLDTDIFGPSLPKMFHVEDAQPYAVEVDGRNLIEPITQYGVKLLSIGFFVRPQTATLWRGGMASNALKQLIADANWGKLDFLILDTPPGTSDIHLTLLQTLTLTGAVIVSTPQDVALADARKGIDMYQNEKVAVPILGLVENMAWFTPAELPDNRYYLFGRDGVKQLAHELQLPLLAQLPLVQSVCESGDKGEPAALNADTMSGQAFISLAQAVVTRVRRIKTKNGNENENGNGNENGNKTEAGGGQKAGKIVSLVLFWLMAALSLSAQTLHVNTPGVSYLFDGATTGDMTYSGGTGTSARNLTISGATFSTADITSITTDRQAFANGSVNVAWTANGAHVTMDGLLAPHATVEVTGGDVSIVFSETYTNEVTYTLSGTSANGMFHMDGSNPATVVLNGLTLTNTDDAAISIDDGKRISLVLKDGTTNTLKDGNGAQKACFYANGHVVVSGNGTLNLTGSVRHAYFSDEYTEVTSGTINVAGAASDGLHVNQYFQLTGGTINIKASGDGIDVGAKISEKPQNGQLLIAGGTLTVNTTGAASKGLKCDNGMTISGGTISVTTTGQATYDSSLADWSSCAALKSGSTFNMTNGTVRLKSTGTAGKGLNATGDIAISGGTLTICTTGAVAVEGKVDSKPHGMKTDGNISITGGNVYVAASGNEGAAYKTNNQFTVNAGTLMGIGGKKSEPTGGTQGYKRYSAVSVSGGQTVSYDGVSFKVDNDYANSSAKIVVSKSGMTK